MNRPPNDSFAHELKSFLAGEHGEGLAAAAALVADIDNPADLLRNIDPDYQRNLYDGLEAADYYELLRKVPMKPRHQLGIQVKAPFRTWSLTSASAMLRQLRRAKPYDMHFGLVLVVRALQEASPVTSTCWPDEMNAEARQRAATRGVPTTTIAEAIELYGLAAVRIAMILADIGSMSEAMNVARVVVEDDLCPLAWRNDEHLMQSAQAYVQLSAAFDAHIHDHSHAHEPEAPEPNAASGLDDEDADEAATAPALSTTDGATNELSADNHMAEPPVVQELGTANDKSQDSKPSTSKPTTVCTQVAPPTAERADVTVSASGAEGDDQVVVRDDPRSQILSALKSMRDLDAHIRALAVSLDDHSGSSLLARQLEALHTPGPEGATIDALAAALRNGVATQEQSGFVVAVVSLASAAADGADRARLRELDAAARRFPLAADLPDLLFDARGRAEPLPIDVATDELADLITAAGAAELPYLNAFVMSADPSPAGDDQDSTIDVPDEAAATNDNPGDVASGTDDTEGATDLSAIDTSRTQQATAAAGPPPTTSDETESDETVPETVETSNDTGAASQPDGEARADVDARSEAVVANVSTDRQPDAVADPADEVAEQTGPVEQSELASEPIMQTDDTQQPASETASPREYRTLLAQAIREGRLSLATHLATGEHDEARRVIIEAACLAKGMRSPSSPLAGAFGSKIGALYEASGDQALRPLLAAAMARAALVAPGTGAGAVCAMLAGQGHTEIGPAAAAVLTTIADAANRGVVFSASSASDDTGRDVEFADLANQARDEMQRQGRSMFARASYVLDKWRQQDQPLWQLLDPVIHDRRVAAGEVAQLASALRNGAARLINETDDAIRTNKQSRITGSAHNILAKRIQTAATIASQWAALAAPATDTHRTGDAAVRAKLAAQRVPLNAELAEITTSPDCLTAACAIVAGRLYDDIYAITSGLIPGGTELSPDDALNADVLRFGLGRTVPDPTVLDQFVQASYPPLADVLAIYSAAHDLESAESLVAICASGPDDCDMTDELAAVKEASRKVLDERRTAAEGILAAHRRRGQLSPELSDTADARLEAAGNVNRRDVGAALTEIDAIVAEFGISAARIAGELTADLDRVEATQTHDAAELERVRSQLAAGELGTADDLLTRLRTGEALGELEHATVDVSTFWPAVPNALTKGIDTEVRNAAASGGKAHGVLDFAELAGNNALVTQAFTGWVQARDKDREQMWLPLLRDALRVLGWEVMSQGRNAASGGPERVWVDFEGVRRTGKAMVPEFGESSGDRIRCLLVWGQPSAEKLVSWSEADNENRPLIVLHFGTMSVKVRSALHDRLRGTNRRPMIVIDDAVLAWVAAQATGTLETTARATLPFSAVNPFVTNTAVVPVEMFYGRVQERRDVMYDPDTTFIYGGRRLGKSALLRAAQREFNTPTQKSIYIDLYDSSIGATRRPEVVWELIERELAAAGIITVTKTMRRRTTPSEEIVVDGVRAWLEADPERRLLVLLDETDAFFDEDALKGFPSTGRFRGLKDSHRGHFKVVFAGLHQVQRFAGHANQPFAQLGRPTPIGPLATQAAFDLISRPLAALGYQFTDPDLVSRLIGRCNSIPILLQACGRQLLTHLRKNDDLGVAVPRPITSADVDAVLADRALDEEIVSRFDMTLELDQRYKVIAYTIALHGSAMTTEALYNDCVGTWAAGFKNNNLTSFRSLVQELVDLGVLTAAPGGLDRGWEIRGINVRALLGSEETILSRLVEISNTTQPPHEFAAGADRMKLANGRSPLSASQITDIMNPGHNQWCLVVGTPASGVEKVSAALREGVSRFSNRAGFVQASSAAMLASALRKTDGAPHTVIVDDMASKDVSGANLEKTVRLVLDDKPAAGPTRSVVFVVTPSQYVEVIELLGDDDGISPDVVAACERYDTQAFDVLHYSLEKGFREPEREMVLALTGGWPELVEHACDLCMTIPNTTSVIAKIRAERTAEGADASLVRQASVADGVIGAAFHTLAQLSPTAADSADIDTLVGLLDEVCSGPSAALVVDALRLGDLLTSEDGESWHCEPVVAAASLSVGQHAATGNE